MDLQKYTLSTPPLPPASIYKLPLRPVAEQEDRNLGQNLGRSQRNDQLLVIEVEQPVIEQQHEDYEREVFGQRLEPGSLAAGKYIFPVHGVVEDGTA